jgi:hypothetical protein
MKPMLTKIAVLLPLVLLVAIVNFVGTGTALAQNSASLTHLVPTPVPNSVPNPAPRPPCGWTQELDLNMSYGVEIKKWDDTCNSEVHCEAIDHSYYGKLEFELEAYTNPKNIGQNVAYTYYPRNATPGDVAPGDDVNTDPISGWPYYACNVLYPHPVLV